MRLLISFLAFLLISSVSNSVIAEPSWQQIDALAQKGKLGDINKQLPLIIKQARAAKNNKSWRDGLLLLANTKLSLNTPDATPRESAIVALTSQLWPNDPDSQLLLNLHLAHYLSKYIQDDGWKIQQRETLDTNNDRLNLDSLRTKSMDQLLAITHNTFAKAYFLALKNGKTLEQFTKPSLKRVDSFFTKNNYPENIRDTLRETVTYLWAEVLSDTIYWTPKQDAEAAQLISTRLLSSPYPEKINPSDHKKHPLKRALKILSDLEQFQLALGNTDGALEAFRVKVETISGVQYSVTAKKQIIHALRLRIKQQLDTKTPSIWLDRLRLDLANKVKNQDTPDAKIQAIAVLEPCLVNNALTELTKLCKEMTDKIKAPYLAIESRESDGINKRSIKLKHGNIDTVYFKAWKIDPRIAIKESSYERSQKLITQKLKQKTKPSYTWQSVVTKTADHNKHATYITPPIKDLGYWLIAASNQQVFPNKNEPGRYLATTTLNLSNLVVDVRSANSKVEVVTYDGKSGLPLPGVKIETFHTNRYDATHRLFSDQNGIARATLGKSGVYRFLLDYQGDITIVDNINSYSLTKASDNTVKDAFIFTDRAIYRPAQTIKWKVIAYQGNSKNVRYRVSPKSKGWVGLYDANDKVVQKIPVTTNHFGSASGEFIVKADRLLGDWSVKTAWGGSKSIKVEEYKRPTFKAKIIKPKQALRLGYWAKITGSVEYYFGGPVSEGTVKWRVKRLSGYSNSRFSDYVEKEKLSNGTTSLNSNG